MQNKINRSRVLITGGAGFIGSHLADKLLSEGYEVVVLDNLSNGSLNNLVEAKMHDAFTFIEGDILDIESCMSASSGIDYIFHLACLGVRHSIHSPLENHKVNAEGTLNVLEAARTCRVKHFFYISTSEVYGRTTTFPITEEASVRPLTVYGASKLAGEHYTGAYFECYNLPVTILRIFNNYGPRAHYEGDAGEIIPRSIVNVLYNQRPIIFGDGSITRDFFFVKDTAAALTQFLQLVQHQHQSETLGKTFNLGTGTEISMRELLEKLLKTMGRADLGIEYMKGRPADVPRLWVKADRFKELTGFTPGYDFEQGLRATINYYQSMMKKESMINNLVVANWIK